MTVNNCAPTSELFFTPGYNPYNPAQQKFNSYVNDISIFSKEFNNLSLYNDAGYFVATDSAQTSDANETNGTNSNTAQGQVPEEDEELGFLGGIGRIIGAPFKYCWEVLKSGGKFIANTAKGAWKATGGALGTLLSGHPIDAICQVFEGLWDVAKAPFQLIGDVVSDTVNYVKDVVGGAGNIIKGAWNGVKDFFKGLF